jgi:molecular chaperone GrpE
MGRRVNIPVRVVRPTEYQAVLPGPRTTRRQPGQRDLVAKPTIEPRRVKKEEQARDVTSTPPVPTEDGPESAAGVLTEPNEWREQALRLQADMDNYRKRQQRLAQDRIQEERQRLLNTFLQVINDLERALAAPASDGEGLRRGVELTHRSALQLLQKEGIEPIQAQGQPFDPKWHEAIATVKRDSNNVAPDTVIQVMEPGYRLGTQLLRPAKVVVAV